MAKPIEVTDGDFAQKVLGSSLPVVVDFTAPWCAPCHMIAPILEELADEYAGKLVITTINVDDNQRYMSSLGVQGAPTLIIFKDGKEIDRLVGARRKLVYQQHFNAVVERSA